MNFHRFGHLAGIKALFGMAFAILLIPQCRAQGRSLVVFVQNPTGRPVARVEIAVEGVGGAQTTGTDGKALLAAGRDTQAGDWVTLVIEHSPTGENFAIVSPWAGRTLIPSFQRKPDNFIRVVVIKKGDLAALENGTVIRSLTEGVLKNLDPSQLMNKDRTETEQAEAANLSLVARKFGLTSDELDQAIRAWGDTSNDPYEAGLAALYERNYPKASDDLRNSLEHRKDKVAIDAKTLGQDKKRAADAAFFLGSSLYAQGKYKESADAYQESYKISGTDNSTLLNNWGLSLLKAGDYAAAMPMLIKSIAISKASGESPTDLAAEYNNLGMLLEDMGQYEAALPVLGSAAQLVEGAVGPEDPHLATAYSNYATALEDNGNIPEAERYYRKALQLQDHTSATDPEGRAMVLTNLGRLLKMKGDLGTAETMYRKALSIPGLNRSQLGDIYLNMGALLYAKHDYKGAGQAYDNATEMYKSTGNEDSPSAAELLLNQGSLAEAVGKTKEAIALYTRALQIALDKLGPDHPITKLIEAALSKLNGVPTK
jgi:tetratricopeptide (TPR) repeat protein